MSKRTEYAHGEFCWVDMMAHDLNQATEFYGTLLGWKAVPQDTQGGPPYTIFQVDGDDVTGLGEMNDEMRSQNIPPMWNNYINVEDVDATAAKVSELGGTVTMPPMQVVDAGRMAFIQDPSGANVAIWQKQNHFGAKRVNEPGCFSWNELATRDAKAASGFFSQLLGWEFEKAPDSPTEYYMITNQGSQNGGMVIMDDAWAEVPPHWVPYFTVNDTDGTIEKLQRLGGQVRVPPVDIPVGRFAVVADNQGATFSIIKMSVDPN